MWPHHACAQSAALSAHARDSLAPAAPLATAPMNLGSSCRQSAAEASCRRRVSGRRGASGCARRTQARSRHPLMAGVGGEGCQQSGCRPTIVGRESVAGLAARPSARITTH
eukprot:COSAG06_NODE_1712_length_8632_cov_71.258409_1_plen_110_part_10